MPNFHLDEVVTDIHKKVTGMKSIQIHTLVLTLLFSQCTVFAEQSNVTGIPEAPAKLKNIELTATGQLLGQFVTHAGLAVPNSEIAVQVGKDTHKITSDERGRFSLCGLQGGRCVIHTSDEVFACQLWAHGTAPPGSIDSIAIVASETSNVRGQSGLWPPPYIPVPARLAALSGKQAALIGLAIAGATVGIVVATNNDDDAS